MRNQNGTGDSNVRKTRGRGQRGFMVLTTAGAALAMVTMAGLVVDLGRMYIAKDETQTFADSVALYAANKLDGTSSGIAAAQAMPAANTNKWSFGKSTFPAPTMEFAKPLASNTSKADSSTWTTTPPNPPTNYAFVRVTAAVDVPLLFMRAVTATTTSQVAAVATAGEVPMTTYVDGLLPFTPVAWDNNDTVNYGFTQGTQYTIRYPSQGGIKKGNVCFGDTNAPWLNNLPSQDRGYWGSNSASAIRGEIVDDEEVQPLSIGQNVPMVGGAKNTEGDALDVRVAEDSDSTSATYAAYVTAGTGNGRRIIGLPVNNGPDNNFVAVAIRAYFLLPYGTYGPLQGSDPYCAEYIGTYVQGAGIRTGAVNNNVGGFQVRLVQ